MRRVSLMLLMCLVAALTVAACGDDNKDGTTASQPATTETQTTDTGASGGEVVQVSADPSGALKFQQDSLTAKPGKDTFEFTNDSSTPHDFAVEQDGKELGKTKVITSSTAKVALDLKAGEHTFYCSVPGHRQAGMEGTLKVE